MLILPRLAALSRSARDVVVAASVLGERATLADAAAMAGTANLAAALDKAERAGLLVEHDTPSGRTVAFPHLLMRQAVYHDLGAEQRRRLHLRAAAIMGGQEALGHRVAAAAGPDAELAADLFAAANAAENAGKLLSAARYLQQAAAATGRGADRDELALSAFELLVRSADVAAADAGRRPGRVATPACRGLTMQELRVARLVASGLSNRGAAAGLYLSPKTVESHLAHAFTKLGVRSRHQLTIRIRDRENPGNPA